MKWVMAAMVGACLSLSPLVSQACQQFYGVAQPKSIATTGNAETLTIVIAGVSVTVYLAGTSTLATIYGDANCATVLANPQTTLADGSYSFYALDGVYDVTLTKAGYAFLPLSGISIFEPLGEHLLTSDRYPSVDVCATGTGLIDREGANVKTVVINKAMTCSQTKTWPTTLTLVCVGQGNILVATTKTLTVNGAVLAPPGRDCFTGSAGTISFGAGAGPYPRGGLGDVTVPYSASMEVNLASGRFHRIIPTNGTAFTINAPINGGVASEPCIQVQNTFGVLGAATFAAGYKLGAAWTQPANGFSRTICFHNVAGTYVEISRTAADVAN